MIVTATGVVDRDEDDVVWVVTPYCVTRFYPDGRKDVAYPESELAVAVILYVSAAFIVAARAVRAFIVNPPTRPAAPPVVAPIRHGKKRPR